MPGPKTAELAGLVKKLIAHGEDAAELNFWLKIFDALSPDKQKKLLSNLNSELEKLELKGKNPRNSA
jgi:hypothetical protein